MKPVADLPINAWQQPQNYRGTFTTRDARAIILKHEGRIMACGYFWEIVGSKPVVGTVTITLRQKAVRGGVPSPVREGVEQRGSEPERVDCPETWTVEGCARTSGLYDLARQEAPDEAVRIAFLRGWARAEDHLLAKQRRQKPPLSIAGPPAVIAFGSVDEADAAVSVLAAAGDFARTELEPGKPTGETIGRLLSNARNYQRAQQRCAETLPVTHASGESEGEKR